MATASSRNPDNIIQPTPVDSNNRFGLPKKPQIPKWDDIIRLSPNSLNYLRNNPKPNINSANGAPELNLASPRTNAPTPRPLSSRLTPHPIQSFQSAKPDPQIETEQLMTMLKQTSPITNLTSDLRQQQQTTSELLSRIDQLTELQQQQVKSISTFDQQLQSAKATIYQGTSDRFVVIWDDQTGGDGNHAIYFSEYDAATRLWSDPSPISQTSVFTGSTQLASLPNGMAIAVWTRTDPTVGPTPRKILEAALGSP